MKTLYLVRHAKSSWKEPGLDDAERPLNKRGKRESPLMGKLLRKNKEVPDLLVSSSAKRAFSTAKRFSKGLKYPVKKIIKDKQLYMADTDDFINVIKNTDNSIESLMIISHNPGITSFANYISVSDIDNIPTCGVVRIDFDIESWEEITGKNGMFKFFKHPKKDLPEENSNEGQ
ncbi:MAG: SixA phosphatase family protein [Ignavibacteria bacterium]